MKLSSLSRSLVLAAGLAILGAGSAMAGNDIFTAQLQAPTSEDRVAVRSTVWNCEGAVCVARPSHSVSVSACRALAREVGPVASYGYEGNQLTDEQLASCNASTLAARNVQTQQAAAE